MKDGVKRLLEVFSKPNDRPRYGLMQHEFVSAFSSDGWSMADFQAATRSAYKAGWIELDAQFYCLTDSGRRALEVSLGDTAGPNDG